MLTTFIHIRLKRPQYNYGIKKLITFNSKITSIIAILLTMYLIYNQRNDSAEIDPAFKSDAKELLDKQNAKNAMYSIVIPEDKKYDDYNPLEKFIYYFSKKQIEQ